MSVDEVVEGAQGTYAVDGVTYKNFKELASAAGISYNAAIKRLHRGWSLKEVFYGRYTAKSFEDDPELASSLGTLYLAQILFNGQVLYKVGITAKSVKQRLKSQKYKLISEYTGMMQDVYSAEQSILTMFENEKCRADSSFDGKTETLLLDGDKVYAVIDYMDSLVSMFNLARVH